MSAAVSNYVIASLMGLLFLTVWALTGLTFAVTCMRRELADVSHMVSDSFEILASMDGRVLEWPDCATGAVVLASRAEMRGRMYGRSISYEDFQALTPAEAADWLASLQPGSVWGKCQRIKTARGAFTITVAPVTLDGEPLRFNRPEAAE